MITPMISPLAPKLSVYRGISGRINPNPTRSIRTVKKIIPSDFFFMQGAAFRPSHGHPAKNLPTRNVKRQPPAGTFRLHPQARDAKLRLL